MTRDFRDRPERRRSRGAASGAPGGTGGGRHDRARIAQAAARLIVLHGLDDWGHAKRKAARLLMLPESTPLPANDEIEHALADYQALFGGETHLRSLRLQRACALEWMLRMSSWAPLLVGGVAAGWAGAHSDVRIELAADDPKSVEIALAARGVHYQVPPQRPRDGAAELLIAEPAASIRLSIVSPVDRRSRPRNDAELRLDVAAVRSLLAAA